jgi:hypothetical protein
VAWIDASGIETSVEVFKPLPSFAKGVRDRWDATIGNHPKPEEQSS